MVDDLLCFISYPSHSYIFHDNIEKLLIEIYSLTKNE